ncbi:hypothetical protein TGPRC2_427580, partial [Toxoplasma gondii TgCatPRC2]
GGFFCGYPGHRTQQRLRSARFACRRHATRSFESSKVSTQTRASSSGQSSTSSHALPAPFPLTTNSRVCRRLCTSRSVRRVRRFASETKSRSRRKSRKKKCANNSCAFSRPRPEQKGNEGKRDFVL